MPRRIGRPGLLGTVARTAVVAGTATAVNRSVNRAGASREQAKADAEAQQHQAPAPAQAPSSTDGDLIAKLKQLGELHSSGVLNDDEFAAAKAKLIA